jgi:choline-sulfatase
MTDQQGPTMMSCTGNPHLRTPAMDSIAEAGVRFERAYCVNPVCVPSRWSLFSGRLPSAIGQRANPSRHIEHIPEEFEQQAMGWTLRRAGYEVAYGGKQHLPQTNAEKLGFDYICKDERDELADVCAEFLRAKHGKPFLLVASFINPHDICYMGIREFAQTDFDHLLVEKGKRELAELDAALQLPEGVSEEEFFEQICPPLPENHEPTDLEAGAIDALLGQRSFRRSERDKWTDREWRLHRWAYARLTERVDGQIAKVLQALRDSGRDKDTVVIFTTDHGDHDAAHKLEHKTFPYDEVARVPMLVAGPGIEPGRVDADHLVSNGLDLIPTLCDLSGAPLPDGLLGRSLRPVLEGQDPDDWREYVVSEWEFGRMVRTDRYKYILCDRGEHPRQLYDMDADPGETRNLAYQPELADVVARHERMLWEWVDRADDRIGKEYVPARS